MGHNSNLKDDDDIHVYLKRDQCTNQAYKIVRDEVFGRHMVATKNISEGEVILIERPLTFGPGKSSFVVCLGCYLFLTESTFVECTGCGVPLCSEACSQVQEHRDFECTAIKKRKYRINPTDIFSWNSDRRESLYYSISFIRALIIKEKEPKLWDLIWMQMSHNENRSQSDYWKDKDEVIINHVKAMIILKEEDYKTIETLLGIFLVNDFEVLVPKYAHEESDESVSIRALYALASMPNHDCVSNSTHTFSNRKNGFIMTMTAARPIMAGEEITHSYTNPFDPILRRKTLLKVGKFFMCNCKRCKDPTEISTFSSALLCSKCHKGNVIPSNCDDIISDWKCDSCRGTIKCAEIAEKMEDIRSKSDALEDVDNMTIENYEKFLSEHSKILHSNHVYMIEKSYTLAKMYGRMKNYEVPNLTDKQLMRKKELCERVLKILDVITPGKTKKKGMMMYELHLSLIVLSDRRLQKGPKENEDVEEIKNNIKNALNYLKMSLKILQEEDENSFEYKIYLGSRESVAQLADWFKAIEKAVH